MAETPIPITTGSGSASVASDLVSGASYQQIKVVDGTLGSNTALIVNSDGTANVRISGSVATAGGTFTGSVSGTVGSSIIGQLPSGTAVLGSIATLQGTNPWNIAGSVAAFQAGTRITSISGGVITSISGGISSVNLTGANTVSVVGTVAVTGSVAVLQGTNPWIITGSVQATAAANQSVSGTVNVGNFPATQAISGSVAVLQGTNPWIITGSVQATAAANQSVSGTVGASIIGNVPVVVQSSVAVTIISGSIAATFTPPANQSVSGTVQTDVRASVAVVIIGGSIAASFTPPANQSVSGTVNIGTGGPVSVTGTMSVLGTVPVTQVTSPWIITGSVQGSFSPAANQSVSGTVNVGSILVAYPAIISAANSTTAPVTSTLSFTGTGEEWKDYGTITVNVFTDAISGVDGLSIQQSSDNANWDIRDTYTIPSMAAGQGKTYGIQPAARFGRIVYTQGAQNSGAFRLQTVYHPQYTKPSSQRPSDGYTNETDLEQNQVFNMLYDETSNTWYRQRGVSSLGTLVYLGASSVVTRTVITSIATAGAVMGSVTALQGTNPWVVNFANSSIIAINAGSVVAVSQGSVITVPQMSSILAVPMGSVITVFQAPSIVGTYAEDAPSASGDKGFLVMGARNDTLASVTSADGDYSSHVVGPAGELISVNAPFTKWVQGVSSVFTATSQVALAKTAASVFTYITAVQVANMSANNVLVTFAGGTNSILGYTIAPANGGSNIVIPNGWKTAANQDFTASISGGTASVYVSAEGFIAKV